MMGDPDLFLEAGIACRQGWTLAQARAQPFEDVLALFAFHCWEADQVRRNTSGEPGALPNTGGSGTRTQVTTTEVRLRPTK